MANFRCISATGKTIERVLNAAFAAEEPIGPAQPAKAVLVDGAEAQEGLYEMRRRDDYTPITRVYAAFAKSLGNDTFAQVFYASPPGQFDEGLEAARSLMRRLHFSVPAHEAPAAASRGAQR